jgi:membrane associated rhomboid family serine protease
MGIYDREYYRREGPSFLATGQVCKWLILINVVAFVIQLITIQRGGTVLDPDGLFVRTPPSTWFTDLFLLDVDKVLQGQVWRLLTYAFLHDTNTWMHIVFNMLFLWWFGKDVEEIYGPREFLSIYLVSAVLGGLAFVLLPMPGLGARSCLGASGAVTAVLVLCALHFPSRVILLFFFLPVPIWVFVLFQVAQDLFGFLSGNAGRTAVTVHLAGAAFAFVYYKRHWRLMSLWASLLSWKRPRSRPRLRVYREEPAQPVPVAAPQAADVDEQLEAKLDAVLEKVARLGQKSLSESEREILLRASEIYKRRRT